MFELYFTPHTCALATHITLEAIGVPYKTRFIDFRLDEQRSPGYLSINPLGRVPALVTRAGVLTETPAILGYLCREFPDSNLAPVNDSLALARMEAFHSFLSSTVHIAHAHGPRGSRWADDAQALAAMKRKVPESVGAAFALVEKHWLLGPWVHGDRLTVSDYYLFTLAQWLESDGVDTDPLPRVMAHRDRVGDLPEVQRAITIQLDELSGGSARR